jgi:heptosyltransferase-3
VTKGVTKGVTTSALLAGADRILFIAHLAIGDFTYLQNDFRSLAHAYPHLRIDLWVDEVRRTDDPRQWPHLKSYVLYDWAEGCGLFGKVYRETYSPALMAQSVRQAQQERYPVVVSLATLRPHQYARLAREIAGDGFAVGMRAKTSLFQLHHLLAYRTLDATLLPHRVGGHISDVYADWFDQLAGIAIAPAERFPYVDIPQRWTDASIAQCAAWDPENAIRKWVFVNPYAKTRKRCWPLERVAQLIAAMQQLPQWRDAGFIINAVPQELAQARAFFASAGLRQAHLFSAEQSFYELPAMLARCDLIISVETAVMHLANAVHVPVIALMRQKNPEWVPVDSAHSTVLVTARRRDWVREITVPQVMQTIEKGNV